MLPVLAPAVLHSQRSSTGTVNSSLDPGLQAEYLARLGLDAEPPSAEALRRLHSHHVERVPYETLWIHSGEAWGLDPKDSLVRIALHGRGGYCYHLNGAFSALMKSLGYVVRHHVGGVHGANGVGPDSVGNHLVLTVTDLPADDNPSGVWYVDVGLGDALHQPLPLVAGDYQQGPFRFVLQGVGPQGWHLQHDPAGGFAGMDWTTPEASWSDFTARHDWLSTSPESGFVRIGMAERRDATGVDVVRGLVVSRIGSDAHIDEPVTTRVEWFEVLADLLGLRFPATAPENLDRLWVRTLDNHRSWEAAGRP